MFNFIPKLFSPAEVAKALPAATEMGGILCDREIQDYCDSHSMIVNPVLKNVRTSLSGDPVISYGLSAYGYDVRLSSEEVKVFRHKPKSLADPKNFDRACLEEVELIKDLDGTYFYLPAHTYALGVSVEKFNMPNDVLGVCVGKSTYARCGIHVNCTPLEPGWKGYLTIEISNGSHSDAVVYTEEGILQILFFKGNPPSMTYAAKAGKYQDQPQKVVLPRG